MSSQTEAILISPKIFKSNENEEKFNLYFDSNEWKSKGNEGKSPRNIKEIKDILESMSLETGEMAKIYFDDDPNSKKEILNPKSEEKIHKGKFNIYKKRL